jgi:hypothetical protein
VIACEFRLHRPSFVLIHLGANDVAGKLFDKSMRKIISYSVESGVVPVLITKADRREGRSNLNNNLLRKIAADYRIPLVDFDLLAATLPASGLGSDGVHLTGTAKMDYTRPNTFKSGHAMHNLSALIGLDAVWRVVSLPP